ncbi:hypothetical protein JTB14_016655 [Gonioctena quinquepunctata]|nr:hypothetical protein JTB14_016655 [Gonioctena quinquepunctata]
MEKLTQFVSKSFENNNNTTLTDHCLNLTFEVQNSPVTPSIKTEKEFTCDEAKKPKNWLISDIEKTDHSSTVGIDLRLNTARNLNNVKCNDMEETNCDPKKETKWCKNNNALKSADCYNSTDSKDSTLCSENICDRSCEKKDDTNKDNSICEENEHKIYSKMERENVLKIKITKHWRLTATVLMLDRLQENSLVQEPH